MSKQEAMRQIKFRGKRLDNGEWVYGSLIADLFHNTTSILTYTSDRASSRYFVDPATVGQYTDLKGKNGVEIYEGDIVKNLRTGKVASIFWHGTFAGFGYSEAKEPQKALREFGELFRIFAHSEVIGKIHDNPELLK